VTARALVVDHAYRLLLLHVTDGAASWWEPPGGEAAAREPSEAAALRVLRAETGLTARVGPCVWVRERGRVVRGVERFHVAWLDDPHAPRAQAAERDRVVGERWWTLDELASSAERFDPDRLPALAPAVVRGEYGPEPVPL
jgi:8-oxo-dGTP pyrophosphatase MutT (NUDIX family)